jgi:hypothetical protein
MSQVWFTQYVGKIRSRYECADCKHTASGLNYFLKGEIEITEEKESNAGKRLELDKKESD